MKQTILMCCCAALCLIALSGCAVSEADAPDPAPVTIDSQTTAPSQTPAPNPTPTPEAVPSPIQEAAEVTYWFGQPVEESEAVEEEWFDDAVFLGDSRTEGLQLYSGLHSGDFYWHRGMSVFQINDPEKRYFEVNGLEMTMLEALSQTSYGKVYIMIGINELGYSAESYGQGLREMIDQVKVIQPDAVIYLQTLPPVNETLATKNNLASYINNANVNAFNEVIVQVAWEKQVALLDVAAAFRTDEGDLAADMASDGVHFYRDGYKLWYEYLKTHTLDETAYANAQPLEEAPVYGAEETEPEPTESSSAEVQETEENVT
jgi:hypothetical protein